MKEKTLNVGVYLAKTIPQSFRVYADNVLSHFSSLNINAIPFSDRGTLPRSADVLWDIRSGGGNPPLEFMIGGPPLVITVHGFAPTTLSGWEYFKTIKGVLMSRRWAAEKRDSWRMMKDSVCRLIAVSEFSRLEAAEFTGIEKERIAVCHHGVDLGEFVPASDGRKERFFLHVSNNEPRKNVDRIVHAFRQMNPGHGTELILKLPQDHAQRFKGIEGVRVVAGLLSTEELAELYRRALGFVFPSLYEGFGMPILEAMASGCAVITSTASACPEVAGEAALLIDPRSESALLDAMNTFATDGLTRKRLVAAGLERVRSFDWKTSAACHAGVLREAAASV